MIKVYLGDGVYADIERDMIKLTASNGEWITNTIYLEPDVYAALVKIATQWVDTGKLRDWEP